MHLVILGKKVEHHHPIDLIIFEMPYWDHFPFKKSQNYPCLSLNSRKKATKKPC